MKSKNSTKTTNTNENSKLTLKNDILFKYFFSKKGNEKNLQAFLDAVLEEKYKIKEILHDSHLEQESKNAKYGVLDLDVKLENGEIINIEMQRKDLHNIEKRLTFHASKKVSEQLIPGDFYDKLNRVIVIGILNYSFIDTKDYINKTITVLEKDRDYEINNEIKYIYIELDKFRKQKPDLGNELNQWLSLIDMEKEDWLEMAMKKNPLVKEAKDKFDNLTDEELKRIEEIRLYSSLEEGDALRLERAEGREEGRAEGRAEGAKNNLIEITKKMLEMNLPIEQIIQITGLKIGKIKQLQKK